MDTIIPEGLPHQYMSWGLGLIKMCHDLKAEVDLLKRQQNYSPVISISSQNAGLSQKPDAVEVELRRTAQQTGKAAAAPKQTAAQLKAAELEKHLPKSDKEDAKEAATKGGVFNQMQYLIELNKKQVLSYSDALQKGLKTPPKPAELKPKQRGENNEAKAGQLDNKMDIPNPIVKFVLECGALYAGPMETRKWITMKMNGDRDAAVYVRSMGGRRVIVYSTQNRIEETKKTCEEIGNVTELTAPEEDAKPLIVRSLLCALYERKGKLPFTVVNNMRAEIAELTGRSIDEVNVRMLVTIDNLIASSTGQKQRAPNAAARVQKMKKNEERVAARGQRKIGALEAWKAFAKVDDLSTATAHTSAAGAARK